MVKYSKYHAIDKKDRSEAVKCVFDTLMSYIDTKIETKPRGNVVIYDMQNFIDRKTDYFHIAFTEFASKKIVPEIPNDKLFNVNPGKWDMFTEEQNLEYEKSIFEQLYNVDNIIYWEICDAIAVGYSVKFGVNMVDDYLDAKPDIENCIGWCLSDIMHDSDNGSICVVTVGLDEEKPYRKFVRTTSVYCDICKAKIGESEHEKGHDNPILRHGGCFLDVTIGNHMFNYIYPGRLCNLCLANLTIDIGKLLEKKGLKDLSTIEEKEMKDYKYKV